MRLPMSRTETDEAAVQKVLKRYFTRTKDGWVNKRAVEEIAAFADERTRLAVLPLLDGKANVVMRTHNFERTCNATLAR